ncbi:MAG: hypothetical protein ILA34_03135 [Bacteroidaceae bacterium]|nr:hypothetical protein [Bacteroidaceae bacterium]
MKRIAMAAKLRKMGGGKIKNVHFFGKNAIYGGSRVAKSLKKGIFARIFGIRNVFPNIKID